MPATSLSGDDLARRSAERARRLALEVEDVEVILRDQYLAEVIVAVDPGLDGADVRSVSASMRAWQAWRRARTIWACSRSAPSSFGTACRNALNAASAWWRTAAAKP